MTVGPRQLLVLRNNATSGPNNMFRLTRGKSVSDCNRRVGGFGFIYIKYAVVAIFGN